jgi:dTDP-4-amino-4,6-dideoxygalactose transaminase
MTDIMAAIGLVELERYDREILPRRKLIMKKYHEAFKAYNWAELPPIENEEKVSSFHLYPLRIKGIDEQTRDKIMQAIFDQDVSVNVHFIPVPMMSYYKSKGYRIENYPITYYNFSREISLPVFEDLHDELVDRVIEAVVKAVESNL